MTEWAYIQGLVESRACSGSCLFGMKSDTDCTCRCKGEYHGLALKAVEAGAAGDVLAGKFFHSFREKDCGCRTVEWQGLTLGRVEPGVYLVQLFDWAFGQPSVQNLVRLDAMSGWNFYSDAVRMTDEFEYHGLASASRRCIDAGHGA